MSVQALKKKFASQIRAVHKNPREKTYSDSLKRAIVKSVKAKKCTRYEIAKALTINPTLVYNWCRK